MFGYLEGLNTTRCTPFGRVLSYVRGDEFH